MILQTTPTTETTKMDTTATIVVSMQVTGVVETTFI